VVFALSNPTSNAEITAEEAYRYSNGKVVFASGSPFPPLLEGETEWRPGQGNNAYIFPGVGLGVIACGARRVSDGMFLRAARALADEVTESDLAHGSLYPPLARIREVSLAIATAVADQAYAEGVASVEKPACLRTYIEGMLYDPRY
jgi:malate dehydrogenase (oxaloacetate-decarboxylating)(NADP+)